MLLKLKLLFAFTIVFLNGYAQFGENPDCLFLKSGHVLTNSGAKSEAELHDMLFQGNYFVKINSNNPESIQSIKNRGVQIISYIPKDAYLVRIPKDVMHSVFFMEGVDAVHAIKPIWKLDQYLSTKTNPPFMPSVPNKVLTEVVLFPGLDMDLQKLKSTLGDLIITIEPTLMGNSFIIELNPDNAIKVAALPFVQFIGVKSEEASDLNYEARLAEKSNTLYTDYLGGLKLFGDSINIIMSDGGKAGDHIDLIGRIDGSNMPSQQVTVHPTQVAGTLTGAGNLDPTMRGQAWGANVYSWAGVMGLHAFPNAYVNDGVTITSVSQGGCCNIGYTQQSQVVDQNTLNHESLINILGAGNSGLTNNNHPSGIGWATIASNYQGAKNNIVVGAVDNADYLENYSSRGPLPDGRIKPDVVAVGTVETAFPGNSYFQASGTSLSCPNTSGVMAQLYQGYKELHNGNLPNSGLMKAVLLNTADDLGNPGPDYIMGYGRINARKAYRALVNETYFYDSLSNGQSTQFSVQVPVGAVGLKVLLYWHDQPGSIMSSKDLVNDLDLVVTDPNGTDWKPWILDPLNADSVAVRNEDHVNNCEQVTISSLVPGTYTFNVNSYDINLGMSQDFFVAYEFIIPQIHVIHPYGGESFSPGSDVNVRWEVEGIEPFTTTTLEYSDNNGQSWNAIGTVSNYSSINLWSAPWVTGGQYLIRATSSVYSDTSNSTFSILKAPINLSIDKVCVDEVTLSWSPTWTAIGYEVYKLGPKYMEYVGNTTNTDFTFTGINTSVENWFSVRALGPNGAQSLRSIAILQEIGDINCNVGIAEEEVSPMVNVFPNPTNGKITINNRSGKIEQVSLINSIGQELECRKNLAVETYVIDLSGFEDGFYYLKIDNSFFKIIKHE
jgi:hypothetical protein